MLNFYLVPKLKGPARFIPKETWMETKQVFLTMAITLGSRHLYTFYAVSCKLGRSIVKNRTLSNRTLFPWFLTTFLTTMWWRRLPKNFGKGHYSCGERVWEVRFILISVWFTAAFRSRRDISNQILTYLPNTIACFLHPCPSTSALYTQLLLQTKQALPFSSNPLIKQCHAAPSYTWTNTVYIIAS